MTDQTLPMTTPSGTGATSQPGGSPEDTLKQLLEVDIPREQKRLREITNASPSQALMEVSGTVLEIVKEAVDQLKGVRDWSYEYMTALSEHMEANDERLEMVEQLGTETSILPEDADVLAKVVAFAQYVGAGLLQGPHPIQEPDESGKAKLIEGLQLCEQAQRIIGESTLGADDEVVPEGATSQVGQAGGVVGNGAG